MKVLLAALLLISTSAFAETLDAKTALLSILYPGDYTGLTPKGEDCNVRMKAYGDSVQITASTANIQKSIVMPKTATYQWNPGNRFFLFTRPGQIENIFRTIAVEDNTQYFVVSDFNRSSSSEVAVECVVYLE